LKLAPVGNRKISFVTVSRLTPQKNLSLMLAFMQRLKTLQYEASLTIVGVGPLLKVLIREVDDLGLSDVHFVGRKKFVVPFLSQFDFFLLTSDYEGFGLALLEAMDSGLAILAPRTSSIPEVLGNDHPGLFSVGNVDSMIEAFLGRISKIDFQKQALELQKKQLDFFSMNRYTEGVDKFYQESMSRR
jgi:glycosyltransferase involved in cell wall biosynthesis